MSAAMEGMQRLIAEADARFEEKLRMCVMGQPTNLNVYSDRTYNLRHQIAHNPQLTTDAHFMELLGHVEVALAPEYSAQGEQDKALRSLLAGLLKTLLRECVTQTSYSLRKIMVEMIWHWYQDKHRQVLDFALDKQFPGARHSRPASAAVVQAVPTRRVDDYNMTDDDWAQLDEAQSKKAASKEENHDPTHVAHKLSLFKQRNLAASEQQRQQIRAGAVPVPQEGGGASPVAGSGVKVVYNKNALERQRLLKSHVETHNGPSGPEVLIHSNSVAPFFNTRPTTSGFARMSGGERGVALMAQPVDMSIVKAEGRIMAHLAQRLGQEQHERERVDMLTMLAHNQARMDEESARRVESQAVSAQTGRACHFVLTKEADAVRYVRSVMDINNNQSFSPYEYNVVDDRIPALVGTLAGAGVGGPSAMAARIGLMSPPNMGTADDELDVVVAADCRLTPSTIRLDRPMREQMMATSTQPTTTATGKALPPPPIQLSDIPVVSRERLQELRMVDRVRNAFAESGAKGSHCPYRSAFKSVVRPSDATLDSCLSLLAVPNQGFPANPYPTDAKKKKKPGPKSAGRR